MSDPAGHSAAQEGTESAPEDVKARMKEALERKASSKHGSASGPDGDSKIHEAHGPASHKRTFRRKSG